jgi:outer membrane protein assembly factor BamB
MSLLLCLAVVLTCDPAQPVENKRPGQVLWSVPENSWLLFPSFDSTTVFFAAKDHRLVAVDKETGQVRWQARTSANSTTGTTGGDNSVVAADVVVLADVDLYAFDRSTGAARWTFVASDLDETGDHRLATDGTTIYAAFFYGKLFAVDARTGALRWVTDLATGDPTNAFNPVVSDGVVYVGLTYLTGPPAGAFVALDANTGAVLWRHEFGQIGGGGTGCYGDAVVAGALVFVADDDGKVYAFDKASGMVAWTVPRATDAPNGSAALQAVAVLGTELIATSIYGSSTGWDASAGSPLWSTRIDPHGVFTHIGSDTGIVVYGTGGQLIAQDASGAVRWRSASVIWPYPMVDGDQVYVPGFTAFYALRR